MRLVCTLHAILEPVLAELPIGIRLCTWLDRRTFRWNHATIANSQDTACLFARTGIESTHMRVIHHGVVARAEAERALRGPAPSPHEPSLGRPPSVGFIGRLSPEKGLNILIEAACLLKKVGWHFKLFIVGTGPEAENVKSLVMACGLGPQVDFEGWRPDVSEYYRKADVIVVPSFRESLGYVALEAMLHGRAVVASRVGGLQEVVSDGETGILVNPGDAEDLARALQQCLANPPLRARLSEAGWRYVLKEHVIEDMIAEIVEVYEMALSVPGAWWGGSTA